DRPALRLRKAPAELAQLGRPVLAADQNGGRVGGADGIARLKVWRPAAPADRDPELTELLDDAVQRLAEAVFVAHPPILSPAGPRALDDAEQRQDYGDDDDEADDVNDAPHANSPLGPDRGSNV